MIPFVDLKKQNLALGAELNAAIGRVVKNGSFTLGAEVEAFETAFADYCGVKHAVGVGSGTDALFMALKAGGVEHGDEVITVPNTFIATAEAISMCGATPVFVDIDPATYNIDPKLIEAKITSRTKAVIPVHLYGQPADMDAVMALARQHGLKVIEDACQAHGAEYRGARAGALGDAGCFSFYPSKNLGALGDGGMVVTNSAEIAEKVRLLRNHGEVKKYAHAVKGHCSRLHGLQAAVLRVKLAHLDAGNAGRRAHAALYNQLLDEDGGRQSIVTPKTAAGGDHVYHLYVVKTPDRDTLIADLAEAGVAAGIHYPVPIHLTEAYRDLGHQVGDFPIAEKAAAEIMSLPMFPELHETEVRQTAGALIQALNARTVAEEEKVGA